LGANSAKEYAHFSASRLWPDQDVVTDDTHFSVFGAYEIARCVLQTGLKAAGLALLRELTDSSAFISSKPDDPDLIRIPVSLDTVFRHATRGTVVRADSSFAVTAGACRRPVPETGSGTLMVYRSSGMVRYPAGFMGEGEFVVRSAQGKKILRMRRGLEMPGGWFPWKEIRMLPAGAYFLSADLENTTVGAARFCIW
jgi:hypothetical protein